MARKSFADHLVSMRAPLETAGDDTRSEVLDEIAIRLYGLPWEDLDPAARRRCAQRVGIDDPSETEHEDEEQHLPLDALIR